MPEKEGYTKAQRRAVKKFRRSFPKGERPPKIRRMTEAQRNAAYEADMRRESGAPAPNFARPQERVKPK
jgi:hypothetical protein